MPYNGSTPRCIHHLNHQVYGLVIFVTKTQNLLPNGTFARIDLQFWGKNVQWIFTNLTGQVESKQGIWPAACMHHLLMQKRPYVCAMLPFLYLLYRKTTKINGNIYMHVAVWRKLNAVKKGYLQIASNRALWTQKQIERWVSLSHTHFMEKG